MNTIAWLGRLVIERIRGIVCALMLKLFSSGGLDDLPNASGRE